MTLNISPKEVEALKRALLDLMANRPGEENGALFYAAHDVYDRILENEYYQKIGGGWNEH